MPLSGPRGTATPSGPLPSRTQGAWAIQDGSPSASCPLTPGSIHLTKTLPASKLPRDNEDQMPDEKRRRFEDYLPREGFADVAISLEQFRTILSDATPGVEWPNYGIDAAFDEVTEYLSRAVGHWGWSSFNTRRQALRERLELLRTSLKTSYILASSGDLREKIDVDLLGFITNVAIEADSGLTPSAMRQKVATAHEQIRQILSDVEAAGAFIEQSSADGPSRHLL